MAVSISERIDRILTEQPIGMSEAARLLGTFRAGRPCHPSTIVRWCLSGVRLADGRQLRLEFVKVANRLVTSRPALLRFLAAQQDSNPEPVEPPRSPGERRRASDRAAADLESLGIG
jgi:hypothetical protein